MSLRRRSSRQSGKTEPIRWSKRPDDDERLEHESAIAILREACPGVRVIVGGAVMTPSLAEYVGADHYAKDAMEAVRILGHR
jgi:hypothetical protein